MLCLPPAALNRRATLVTLPQPCPARPSRAAGSCFHQRQAFEPTALTAERTAAYPGGSPETGQAALHQFFSIPTDIMRSVVKLPYRTMCRSFLITGMDRSNPAPCDICQDGVSERDQPVLQFYRQVIRVPAKDRRLTALPAFDPR